LENSIVKFKCLINQIESYYSKLNKFKSSFFFDYFLGKKSLFYFYPTDGIFFYYSIIMPEKGSSLFTKIKIKLNNFMISVNA